MENRSDMELKPQVAVAESLFVVGLDGGAHTIPPNWLPPLTSRTSDEDTKAALPVITSVLEVNEEVESAVVADDSADGGGGLATRSWRRAKWDVDVWLSP